MNMNLTNLKHQTAKDVGSISKSIPIELLKCVPTFITHHTLWTSPTLDVDDDGDGFSDLKEL